MFHYMISLINDKQFHRSLASALFPQSNNNGAFAMVAIALNDGISEIHAKPTEQYRERRECG